MRQVQALIPTNDLLCPRLVEGRDSGGLMLTIPSIVQSLPNRAVCARRLLIATRTTAPRPLLEAELLFQSTPLRILRAQVESPLGFAQRHRNRSKAETTYPAGGLDQGAVDGAIAGLRADSQNIRKLVGAVFIDVRSTALSIPSSLARYIST